MARSKKVSAVTSWKDGLRSVNDKLRGTEEELEFSGRFLSTGCLTADLGLGGGAGEGRILGFTGPEKSGKTTLIYEMILTAYVEYDIEPQIYDHEGSFDFAYMQQIADAKYGGVRVDEVIRREDTEFGPQNYFQPETGEWTISHVGSSLRTLRRIPKGTRPQILFVVDSLAAMQPEAGIDTEEVTENEDGSTTTTTKRANSSMGMKARMFSDGFPKFKTALAKAGCYMAVTNQLRFKIGTMFGSPETEPGGNAVAHYVDQRINMRPVSPSDKIKFKIVKVKGQGGISGICKEDHVSGIGWDKLVYSRGCVVKNKCARPLMNFDCRIVVSEQGGSGAGIDWIADTVMFLMETGQVKKTQGYYYLKLLDFDEETGEPNHDEPLLEPSSRLSWVELKRLIGRPGMEESVAGIEIYTDADADGVLDIREHCKAQLRSGCAQVLYADVLASRAGGGGRLGWAEVTGIVEGKKGRKKFVEALEVEDEDGHTWEVPLPDLTQAQGDRWLKDPDLIVGKRVKVPEAGVQRLEEDEDDMDLDLPDGDAPLGVDEDEEEEAPPPPRRPERERTKKKPIDKNKIREKLKRIRSGR